jgi:hypothetical protein
MSEEEEGAGRNIATLAKMLVTTLNQSSELQCSIVHQEQTNNLQDMLLRSKAESYLTQLHFVELERQALELSAVGDGAEVIPSLQARYVAAWENHLAWMEHSNERLSEEKQKLAQELDYLSDAGGARGATFAVEELRSMLNCTLGKQRQTKPSEAKPISPAERRGCRSDLPSLQRLNAHLEMVTSMARACAPPTFSDLPGSRVGQDRFMMEEASNPPSRQFLLRPHQVMHDAEMPKSMGTIERPLSHALGPQPTRPVRRLQSAGSAVPSRTSEKTPPRNPPRQVRAAKTKGFAWSPPEH